MWSVSLSEVRMGRGALYLVLLLLAYCTGGKCEIQDTNPLSVTNVPAVKPDNNQPQAFPSEEKNNLPVFMMDYPRIQLPFEFTLWVLLASFAKIGFHIYHKVTIWIPESCLLIAIGLIVGAIMHSVKEEPPAVLSSNVFFLYMLPPIVLDGGYFMPTRPFFENIGTVLWYAVVGTLLGSIGIGLSLFAICQFEVFGVQDINLQENLLFAAIISAVDPVAVLNVLRILESMSRYIVIFGEGLFSDAVTVHGGASLLRTPRLEKAKGDAHISPGCRRQMVTLLSVRAWIEPLFVFMYSYLAYLVAELFAISSVVAIITCAITMKYYVEENVSQRSCTTIRHVVKVLAIISETIFFLGVVTITTEHEWNWAYIVFTLVFAFIWRSIGILVLTRRGIPPENLTRSVFFLCIRFKKFNDHILRRILLQENKEESSIVSLYKRLELQNAIELLDTSVGDISAAPSVVSINDDRNEASRPKKTFLAGDVRKMHDILSKYMYKIRQKTQAYTSKYNLPDNSQAREILIRCHPTVRRSLRASSFRDTPSQNIPRSQKYFSLQPGGDLESAFARRRHSQGGGDEVVRLSARLQSSGVSPRSSFRSFVPLRTLNTIRESGDSLHRLEDNRDQEFRSAGEEEETPIPTPPQVWVPENQDPREHGAGNPLLRCTAEGSQDSWRS
ncbi:sodium/hydrogen exchanger 2-like [Thalassophryne amazonica]|uniref:sodium/hydrogen exchanger 2-like n=1 Tax=Thalassophryne amazonica TaxID=390379 RepID=UPI001471FC23|nr:sodium/hydrogen exchanger 2-like [Thalassophryne amazonica]